MGETQPAERPTGQVRRGAIWPWLAMPLVALAAFFALRGCHAEMSRDPGAPGSEAAAIGSIGGQRAGP